MTYDRIPKRAGSLVETSADAACLFAEAMGDLAREELWVLSIDEDCGARWIAQVAVGTKDGLALEVRDIVRATEATGCRALVIGHNHPSGDPRPSLDDWIATKDALEACEAAGLELVDHLVLGDGVYVSLRSMNEELFVRHLPEDLR